MDAALVFWLLCFAFLRRLNHYLCAECLKFCLRQWSPYCLHLSKLQKFRLNFSSFDSKTWRMRVLDNASLTTRSNYEWWSAFVGTKFPFWNTRGSIWCFSPSKHPNSNVIIMPYLHIDIYVKAWSNARNIVGHNMLYTFGYPVAICCDRLQHVGWCWNKFENGQIFRATFWMLYDVVLVWPRSRNIVALGHAH